MCTQTHESENIQSEKGTRLLKYVLLLLIIIITILCSRLEKVLPAEIYFLIDSFLFLFLSYLYPNNNYSISTSLDSTRSAYNSFLNTHIFSKANAKFCLKTLTH